MKLWKNRLNLARSSHRNLKILKIVKNSKNTWNFEFKLNWNRVWSTPNWLSLFTIKPWLLDLLDFMDLWIDGDWFIVKVKLFYQVRQARLSHSLLKRVNSPGAWSLVTCHILLFLKRICAYRCRKSTGTEPDLSGNNLSKLDWFECILPKIFK